VVDGNSVKVNIALEVKVDGLNRSRCLICKFPFEVDICN
jgi:hypothetical protein